MLNAAFTASLQRATKILKRQREGKTIAETDLAFCERIAGANAPQPAGRPRQEGGHRLPIFDNLQQASALGHIPRSLLQQAKRTGCPAFKWNRVDLGEFLKWLFTHEVDDEDSADWSKELKKWLAKLAKLRHDKEARKVMDMVEAEAQIRACMALIFAGLDKRDFELAPVLKGQDEATIYKRSQEETERLKDSLREQFPALALNFPVKKS